MNIQLNSIQARILGCLIEKEATTPDYYPLSLNALVNACNQKNNREPVMQVDEDSVRQAVHGLEDFGLAGASRGIDSRVAKYEHRLQEVFNPTRAETAILCVLLLRGPQTLGELRGRAERMYVFEQLSDVQSVLERLMQRQPPLANLLARRPGEKEARYAHLLVKEQEQEAGVNAQIAMPAKHLDSDGRVLRLEHEVEKLQAELIEIKQRVDQILKTSDTI